MTFSIANDLVFESGALSRIADIISGRFAPKKILIVCGKSLFRSGKGDAMLQSLTGAGIAYELFQEVPNDPTDVSIDACAATYRTAGIDMVLAVGGGSVMDFSKGLCLCLTNDAPVDSFEGAHGVANKPTTMVAVPTTSGTGSEVTSVAVITNTKEVRKGVVGGPHVRAALAVCDPTLVQSLPAHLTAFTGMDALTHAVEAYTSRMANPITDMMALEAIRLIGTYLPLAYRDGENPEYREKMMLGSTIAGYAFDNALLGMVHAMAHPMGARFHVQHGAANAILLAESVRYNAVAAPEKTKQVGIALGLDPATVTCDAAADRIAALAEELNIPKLRDTGIAPEHFSLLAEDAMRESCMPCNPRPCSVADIVEIYKKLY